MPLPSNQSLNNIAVGAANEQFTISEAGTYQISYSLRFTAGVLVSSRVLQNGVAIPQSVVSPTVALTNASANFIVTLAAGDTITLQLFGLLGAAILQGGQGAALSIVRIA
ncbi:hypothetical protein JCM19039_4318 [Geomicrobium sp. JCM 19039]|nr:hypothetical protein JCM19039_4318 [Geomicrobium sp. JCM 19039]